jgi:hypothetical protein
MILTGVLVAIVNGSLSSMIPASMDAAYDGRTEPMRC